MNWKEEYKRKLTTPAEAVKVIKSGDRVYAGTASSYAYALLDALWERRHELENVTISGSNGYQSTPIFDNQDDNPFLFNTYFMGIGERKVYRKGLPVYFNSVHLSEVDLWARENSKPNVAFFEVSLPDEDGYFTFGPSGVTVGETVKEIADTVIIQVNKYVPYVLGENNKIHVSEVDIITEEDRPYDKYIAQEPDDISKTIAGYILDEIPDGATFQLGLGNISNAIGFGLMEKNDLGIYTELLNEPMFRLMKNGNVTNKNKGYMNGKTVYAFTFGSPELYEDMNKNPNYYVVPFRTSNDARLIAMNKKMISINATMAFNIYGEAASDCISWNQQSGVGGQLDYVRGAQWSEGGKSFLVTSSTFEKNGELHSKILPYFAPGTAVTTPRSDVQYVATEYGCINLKPLTMQDRAKAMISLAHPKFRDWLTDEAKKAGLLK